MTKPAAPQSILIVDDDPDSLETLRLLLLHEGYAVCGAASGAEALTLIREQRPDLVILDIMMPAMTGYDLVRHLRADPTMHDIPCIAYSGYQQLRHSNSDLYDRVLIKPAEFSELLSAVRSLLLPPPP